MKKIYMLFLLILSISVMTSCFNNVNKTDPKLNYSYSSKQEEQIIEKMNLFADELDSLEKEEFEKRWKEIEDEMYDVATYSSLASIKSNLYNDEKSSDDYLRLSKLLNKLLEIENTILINIYNSKHKDYFFVDYTEEQINDILNKKYNNEYYELSNQADEIIAEYTLLDTEAADWKTKVDELYIELVGVNNKIAKLLKYDNYMEYAYDDIYNRDYRVEDARVFSSYISRYIVKEFAELMSSVQNKLSSIKYSSIMIYNNFYNSNYEKNMFYYENYSKYIGGDFLESYNKAWKSDSYLFIGDANSMPAAYTTYIYNADQPAMYFGYGYQDILTVAHETGHYYAADLAKGLNFPLDLAEVHSQANELLFLNYLEQNYISDFYNEGMYLIHLEQLLSALNIIIIATIVNDFEMLVYEAEKLSSEILDQLFAQACLPYGGVEYLTALFGGYDIRDYWRNVCIDNAGYYISYAMSLIPSLDLYTISKADLDLAIDKYLTLCSSKDSFLNTLSNSNLSNPFNEEVYINICNIYN